MLLTMLRYAQVRAFEQMWAMQLLQLDNQSLPSYSTSSKGLWYLKVGAAALGGGALLAVTGGLAAPAIAAGEGGTNALMRCSCVVSHPIISTTSCSYVTSNVHQAVPQHQGG